MAVPPVGYTKPKYSEATSAMNATDVPSSHM